MDCVDWRANAPTHDIHSQVFKNSPAKQTMSADQSQPAGDRY